MSDGLFVSLNELIALKRFATKRLPIHKASANVHGAYLTKRRGRGMEFSETRHYQAGDEIRHMEWRVTARTGRAHVKCYQEERERPVLFITDFNPSMYFGTQHCFKSVLAAQLTALLAWRAAHQKDKVGGLLFSATTHHEYSPHTHHSHLMRLLNQLVTYTESIVPPTQAARPLSEMLKRAKQINHPGSLIFILSDFYALDTESDPLLRALSAHNEVFAIHLSDPIERTAPPPGAYPMGIGDDILFMDTTDPKQQQGYNHYWETRTQDLQTRFQQLGIRYLQQQTTQPLTTLLPLLLPGRRHVYA